jgi:hypothetical protein
MTAALCIPGGALGGLPPGFEDLSFTLGEVLFLVAAGFVGHSRSSYCRTGGVNTAIRSRGEEEVPA